MNKLERILLIILPLLLVGCVEVDWTESRPLPVDVQATAAEIVSATLTAVPTPTPMLVSAPTPVPGLIDQMETTIHWGVGRGNGATFTTLITTVGYEGQAIQLDYDLGGSAGAWAQLRRNFDPLLDLSSCDCLHIRYHGTTTNTLEIGLVSTLDENYFSRLRHTTFAPAWSDGLWDLQDFCKHNDKRNCVPFPDLGQVKAIFISVVKVREDDVGGAGSLVLDSIQCISCPASDPDCAP
jgi:hypothetical protein